MQQLRRRADLSLHPILLRPLKAFAAGLFASGEEINLMTDGQPASGKNAILLIDDNAVQAATRQTILKRAGYFVIAVLNPMRALEQFKAGDFPAEIGLVITDHLMPGMTGSEFVQQLRQSHQEIPVLVISGLEEAEDEYKDLHVTFRMKPLLPENLLMNVQTLIG